jgi:hypothetical protein
MTSKKIIFACFAFLIFVSSCYRNNIEFGNLPDTNYTNIVFIDSVQPRLSTIVFDSFPTNSSTSFLFGKYKDPLLGIVSTKPFFQMTIPSATNIAASSQFDSVCFIIRLNKYHNGDTNRLQTIYVNELSQVIDYTYNNHLYNTSSTAQKSPPLGSRAVRIRPSVDDSVVIRLSDVKGAELFNKLKQQSSDVTVDDDFQNYFKGISISVGSNDTTSVYGLNGSAGSMVMRIYYHKTIPYLENKFIDFTSKANNYSFNQITADRTGTVLYSTSAGLKEFGSEQTNNVSFVQNGTGVLLKLTFPSLKGIITTDKIVKLQKAELILRPIGQTYNDLPLPPSLYLAKTDGTNSVGTVILDSTLTTQQIVSPVIDNLYGVNTYYRFNITYYINAMLNTAGSEDQGFFLMESANNLQVNRTVIGNSKQSLFKTQLLLTVITINK